MIEKGTLNQYSLKVYEQIFERHKELLAHATVCSNELAENFLRIEFVCENKQSSGNLIFGTEEGQIIVSFDKIHGHFDGFQGLSFADEVAGAADMMTKILSEEWVAVSYYEAGSFLGSIIGDITEMESIKTQLPEWIKGKCDNIRIISWNGTYDFRRNI